MSASVSFPEGISLKEKYGILSTSLQALLGTERDEIANMANFSAALHHAFDFHWTGFYVVKNRQLVLGPFQGPIACTRISFGKGVCGTAWSQKKSLVVQNVHEFPGHIACSALSNSEIVIPLFNQLGEVHAVLDIDSTALHFFTEEHVKGLESCVAVLQNVLIDTLDEKIQA